MGKREILDFLKKHDVCVLATCCGNKTEAAAVSYVVDDNFIFYITTSKSYRKYRNLAKNKNVSIVVWSGESTAQIDGKAEFLKPKEIELVRPFMLEKIPELEDFLKIKDIVFLKIVPKYIKMPVFVKGKEKIDEIKF